MVLDVKVFQGALERDAVERRRRWDGEFEALTQVAHVQFARQRRFAVAIALSGERLNPGTLHLGEQRFGARWVQSLGRFHH